uniref:Uncharacterized protein n=1 Tax=Glossina austeni TaxID=7395 RepID=A0A1A9UPC2_GLOAU
MQAVAAITRPKTSVIINSKVNYNYLKARTRRKGNPGSRKINANKSATPSPTSPLTQSSASSLQTSTFKLVSSSTPASLASIYSIVTPSNVVVFSVAVASSSIASITTSMSPTSQTPPSSRTSLFDSCHRKIRLIGGGPVAFLGGLVADLRLSGYYKLDMFIVLEGVEKGNIVNINARLRMSRNKYPVFGKRPVVHYLASICTLKQFNMSLSVDYFCLPDVSRTWRID